MDLIWLQWEAEISCSALAAELALMAHFGWAPSTQRTVRLTLRFEWGGGFPCEPAFTGDLSNLGGAEKNDWVEEGDPGCPGVSQLCRPSLIQLPIPSICSYNLPIIPIHMAFCACFPGW